MKAALFCLPPLWVGDVVRAFGWMVLPRETGIVSRALRRAGLVAGLSAFDDSAFPSLPWRGFAPDRFFGAAEPRPGRFHDRRLPRSIAVSAAAGGPAACHPTVGSLS